MKKRTLEKLLHDPDFDPAAFLEPAIMQFLGRNPVHVAKDQVAIKYLVDDDEVVNLIWEAIDINNVDLMKRFFSTLSTVRYGKEDACEKILGRFTELDPEKADDIFGVLKEAAPNFQSISRPKCFGNLRPFIAEDKLFQLMSAALNEDKTKEWTPADWEVAIESEDGIEGFFRALKKDTIKFKKDPKPDENFFHFVSKMAQKVKGTKHAKTLITACEEKWKGFVCFTCGRGSGVDRYGHKVDNNEIRSNSGFTLHTNNCATSFPSPWKIITGLERELSFECDRCGLTFTTTSGLTLHKKKC